MEKNNSTKISPLDKQFAKMEKELEREQFSAPAPAFDNDSKVIQEKRIAKAMNDFFYFDRMYFPEEYHRQGYYKPGVLHYEMLKKSLEPGIHWFGTFRNLAKTTYLKKIRIWQLLTGRIYIAAIMSETMPKAENFVSSIGLALKDNERIKKDFEIEIDRFNQNMLRFTSKFVKGYSYYLPYSLQANARGDNVKIERPDVMDFDDIETNRLNNTEANTTKRLESILEAYRSCKENANMLGVGNNIHPKCLFNRLKILQEKGKRDGLIIVYPYPVWSNKITEFTPYLGSVWQSKYKADNIDEMRKLINPQDEVEWSQAMCNPLLKSGDKFPRELLKTYKEATLPSDAFGPAYCDPNMSLKGQGDTTAMLALLYSRSMDKYYVYKPKCKSYSNSNDLLMDYLTMFDSRIQIMGMDGNVNQESSWNNNIRNFTLTKGIPLPPIIFFRYSVDNISNHASAAYKEGKILFPEEYIQTDEGKEFMNQIFTFISKKENSVDDAPDGLVCVYQIGHERGMFIPNLVSGGNPYESIGIGNPFSF